eukprot:scaffold34427_cov38-Prasinocladus_malaysianus.AAC.1
MASGTRSRVAAQPRHNVSRLVLVRVDDALSTLNYYSTRTSRAIGTGHFIERTSFDALDLVKSLRAEQPQALLNAEAPG